MKSDTAVDLYVKQIKKLICNLFPAEEFIHSLQDMLSDYCIDHPDCTIEELIEQFGAPEDIARDFLDDTSEALEPKEISKTNKKLKISIVVLTLFLAVSISLVIKAMQPTPMQPAKEVNIIDQTQ